MKKLLFLSLLFPFAFSTLFAEVAEDAENINALKADAEAPNPTLTRLDGESISLKDLRNGEPTVLVFYRGGWCPYCTRQLSALQEVMPELKEKGWKLIAVSPDKAQKLMETDLEYDLDYELVSDSKMEAAKAFGIAFQLQEAMLKKLSSYKIDVVAASGQPHQQLPVPSVFLIDAEGKITYAYSNPDYKVRLSSEELLKAASGE